MIKDLLLKHKTAFVNSTQNIFLITWNQANWTLELRFPLLIERLHNMTGLKVKIKYNNLDTKMKCMIHYIYMFCQTLDLNRSFFS